jgi:hypothetical protein
MNDYKQEISFDNVEHSSIYNALTSEIPRWWTDSFSGVSDMQNGVFTVKFGEGIFKTIRVESLTSSNIVWMVEDALIRIPQLQNQTEWIGTKIIWEIISEGPGTILRLTHIGLNSKFECYDICSDGWKEFAQSLKAYLETGEGFPFKR